MRSEPAGSSRAIHFLNPVAVGVVDEVPEAGHLARVGWIGRRARGTDRDDEVGGAGRFQLACDRPTFL
ncbi:hypothetical protein [Streptosporangium sp. NPDC002607]